MNELGITHRLEEIYQSYKIHSQALWALLEEGKTTKDFLKVERFRRTFEKYELEVDPHRASELYLDTLPETVVLIDHATEICQHLSEKGEIGILTNGIESVQKRRLEKSGLLPYISFTAVSEACGFAKPDPRFFDHSVKMAKSFTKENSLMIGDRIETDILGALNYGLDSCLFNPQKIPVAGPHKPRYEIAHLSELRSIIL